MFGAQAFARPALDKPNVIVILLDDAGYADFSHTGNPTIHTPQISKLANEGLNFPQFYSGAPACSASRYALLTGRSPARSGLGQWVIDPESKTHIHPKEITLAEGLKSRGYKTAICGKWHLGTPNASNGMTPEALPLAHGFDQWIGTQVSHDYANAQLIESKPGGKTPVDGYEVIEPQLARNAKAQEGLTQLYTDRAIEFIHQNADDPFFIYLTPNMPHLGVYVSDEFKGKSPRGAYGDCMEEIDANVGRIREALDDEGIAKNTLIIFTSDNGPWMKFQDTANDPKYGEARTLVGSALPFRDGKGSTWEGGVRVPGVWYWPGTIRPATVERGPASSCDILPTVFSLAGVPIPKDRKLDGRDIRPLLNADVFPGKVGIFRYAYTGAKNEVCGIRVGPWKLSTSLVSQVNPGGWGFTASKEKPLLFQVEKDVGERIDRAAESKIEVEQIQVSLNGFLESLNKETAFWDRK